MAFGSFDSTVRPNPHCTLAPQAMAPGLMAVCLATQVRVWRPAAKGAAGGAEEAIEGFYDTGVADIGDTDLEDDGE